MSTRDVSRLETYRSRRAQRLTQARALYGGDPTRAGLVDSIELILGVTGGDRAAVLWVDEYGSARPHVFCIVDVSADTARRSFSLEQLREAWNKGVPGVLDVPSAPNGPKSSLTIALGSDGTRAWFLASDSNTPRARLDESSIAACMFEAGRVGSVVLHRDQPADGAGSLEPGFAGWGVLQDAGQTDRDDETARRIATRFLIARLVRSVVEADFSTADESLTERLSSIEREFAVLDPNERERQSWERITAAVSGGDPEEMAAAVLELADLVYSQGHREGAGELYESAYLVGMTAGIEGAAIDGARFLARNCREIADWEGSIRWYGHARDMAEAYGETRRLAMCLDGLGNTFRERGELPRARELHRETVLIGERMGDGDVEAWGWHSLMIDDQSAGDPASAIRNGWTAFEKYGSERMRLRLLTNLAWALVGIGELDAAFNAYRFVAEQTKDQKHMLISLDAMAYIEAERGDRTIYEQRLAVVDEYPWRESSVYTVAEFLFYRGRGYGVLGDVATSEAWLNEALEFSRSTGNIKVERRTTTALEQLATEGRVDPIHAQADTASSVAHSQFDELRAKLERLVAGRGIA